MKLSLRGDQLAHHDALLDEYSFAYADLEGNGRQSVLITDSRGFVHVLDPSLDLGSVRKVEITPCRWDWVTLRLEAVADLDGDGSKELVFRSTQVEFVSGTNPGRPEGERNLRNYHDNCLLVYGTDFRLRGRYEIAEILKNPPAFLVHVLPPGPDGRRQLLVLTDKAVFLELRPR